MRSILPPIARFSRFTAELPNMRFTEIEKNPKLARKQGLYSVVTATGLILKRGPDLARVIAVLDKRLKLVRGDFKKSQGKSLILLRNRACSKSQDHTWMRLPEVHSHRPSIVPKRFT